MPSGAPIQFVDSHTEGEPTRTVVGGAPRLSGASVADMAEDLATRHDWFRAACVTEPRGNDVLVGALLVPTPDPSCATGVIFFNNVGVLGMCGHGAIGVVRTLAHLGRIDPSVARRVRLDTPVGTVEAAYEPGAHDHEPHLAAVAAPTVEIANVRSFVQSRDLRLRLADGTRVTGDLAWGGNWFYVCEDHGERIDASNLARLAERCTQIREALAAAGYASIGGRPVDHVELVGPPHDSANDARNFVLCPGGAYDRSPCGTGTSAKLACLASRGLLAPGATWRQESVVGSVFEARYLPSPGGGVLPCIRGRAWITAEGVLRIDPSDPFRHGIPATAAHAAPAVRGGAGSRGAAQEVRAP